MLPVCSPQLLTRRSNPLKKPADLANHTLLAVDIPSGMALTSDWEPWLTLTGLREVRTKATLRFSQYSDVIAAAVAGQGIAIGRLPLLNALLRSKQLVTPFKSGASSQRGYFVEMGNSAAHNPHAHDFANWLRAEAQAASSKN